MIFLEILFLMLTPCMRVVVQLLRMKERLAEAEEEKRKLIAAAAAGAAPGDG